MACPLTKTRFLTAGLYFSLSLTFGVFAGNGKSGSLGTLVTTEYVVCKESSDLSGYTIRILIGKPDPIYDIEAVTGVPLYHSNLVPFGNSSAFLIAILASGT